MTRAALERCLAEQREAAAYLLAHPGDRGAALWLADWVAEELEILMGKEQTEA